LSTHIPTHIELSTTDDAFLCSLMLMLFASLHWSSCVPLLLQFSSLVYIQELSKCCDSRLWWNNVRNFKSPI